MGVGHPDPRLPSLTVSREEKFVHPGHPVLLRIEKSRFREFEKKVACLIVCRGLLIVLSHHDPTAAQRRLCNTQTERGNVQLFYQQSA